MTRAFATRGIFEDTESSGDSSSIVGLERYATAGAGTFASPWTGWESAFALIAKPGTVSVAHSVSTVVATGVGTTFTSYQVGQYLGVSTASGLSWGKVSIITDDTHVTLESWKGATASASAFYVASPTSVVAPSGVFEFSSAINLALPFFSLRGRGGSTIFRHVGSGKAVTAIGDYSSNSSQAFGVSLSDFTVQGNANTTDCLWVENCQHFELHDIYLHNATNSYVTVKDLVGGSMTHVRGTVNAETSSPSPSYGLHYVNVYGVTEVACYWEGSGVGRYAESGSFNTLIGGATEGSATIGTRCGRNWDSNILIGIDHEANPNVATGVDIKLEGSARNTFININSNSKIWVTGDGVGNASWNRFIGGVFGNVVIDAGCGRNDWHGCSYNNSGGQTFSIDPTAYGGTYINVNDRQTGALLFGGIAVEGGTFTARRHGFPGISPGLSGVSGFGASPTLVVDSASDASMVFTVTAGAGAASTGTLVVTYSTTLTNVIPVPVVSFMSGTGAWASGAAYSITASSTTGFTVSWSNNGVALTNGTSYKFGIINVPH